MKNNISLLLALPLSLLLILMNIQPGYSQKKDRVRMKITYTKDKKADRFIDVTLTAGSGKSMHGVKNGAINITTLKGDSTMVLATLSTDTLGTARLYFDKNYKLPVNEDGICIISGSYEGDDSYEGSSNELQVKDIDIWIAFQERDSIRYLVLTAKQLDLDGNVVPVEELEINVGVERLFSILSIGEVATDAEGWAELEVPTDLPGDSTGNLVFVAQIEEHDLFGTVVNTASKEWGRPVSYVVKPLPRQLFTDEAPFWMIASVFIILLGAWYHFFLSVSKLIKLKKAG